MKKSEEWDFKLQAWVGSVTRNAMFLALPTGCTHIVDFNFQVCRTCLAVFAKINSLGGCRAVPADQGLLLWSIFPLLLPFASVFCFGLLLDYFPPIDQILYLEFSYIPF